MELRTCSDSPSLEVKCDKRVPSIYDKMSMGKCELDIYPWKFDF